MYKYSEIPTGKVEDIIFLRCIASETILTEFFKKWKQNEPIRKITNFFTTGSITWIFKSYWNTSSLTALIENNKYSMNFEKSFFEEIKLLDLPWRLKTQAEMLRDGQIVPGDTRPITWNNTMEKYFGALIPKSVVKEKFDFNLAMTGSRNCLRIPELENWSYRYELMTYVQGDIDSKQVPDKPSVPTSYWRFKTKEEFIEEYRWQSKGYPSGWNSDGKMNTYLGERIPKECISYCEKGQTFSLSNVGWIFQSRDYTNKPLPTSSSKAPETPVRYRFKTEAEFKSEGQWDIRESEGCPSGWVPRLRKYLGKEIPKELIHHCQMGESFMIDSWWFDAWDCTPIILDSPSKSTFQEQIAEAEKKIVDEFCIKHPLKTDGAFLGYRLLTAKEAEEKLGWNYDAEMANGWGVADNKFFQGYKVSEEYSEIYGRDVYGLFLPGITKEDYESASERIQFQTKSINKAWITECYTGDGHKLASKPFNSIASAVAQSDAAIEMMGVYAERLNPCAEMVRGLDPYESERSLQLIEMRSSNKLNAELSADSRLLEEAKIHLYISKKSNLLTIN